MKTNQLSRRNFLEGGAASIAAAPLLSARARARQTLPAWSPGTLDIHHISTGRGSCAFFLFPDGTTMMVDAGATRPTAEIEKYIISPKPDGSRRPGEWIGRYVGRQIAAANRNRIDYFVLTHFHGDHMGEVWPDLPLSSDGSYRLTGVSDVAQMVPIERVIDRGYPDYNYPAPVGDEHVRNYRAFLNSLSARGGSIERITVGSKTQIRLLHAAAEYPTFHVRNLVANGEVWTGVENSTRHYFPALSNLKPDEYPTENMCSLGIRVSYGSFDYFTAGDMSHDTNAGADPWRDIETPVAKVAGPVDVAVANHHGYVDATGAEFVRALRPRAFVINAWDSAHPTMPALHNMLNTSLYPGKRDIFATAIKPESKIAVRRLAELTSENGHVVIRVSPGGGEFRVFITSNGDEEGGITAVFGPFATT